LFIYLLFVDCWFDESRCLIELLLNVILSRAKRRKWKMNFYFLKKSSFPAKVSRKVEICFFQQGIKFRKNHVYRSELTFKKKSSVWWLGILIEILPGETIHIKTHTKYYFFDWNFYGTSSFEDLLWLVTYRVTLSKSGIQLLCLLLDYFCLFILNNYFQTEKQSN